MPSRLLSFFSPPIGLDLGHCVRNVTLELSGKEWSLVQGDKFQLQLDPISSHAARFALFH